MAGFGAGETRSSDDASTGSGDDTSAAPIPLPVRRRGARVERRRPQVTHAELATTIFCVAQVAASSLGVGRLRSWCGPSGESAGISRMRERRTRPSSTGRKEALQERVSAEGGAAPVAGLRA